MNHSWRGVPIATALFLAVAVLAAPPDTSATNSNAAPVAETKVVTYQPAVPSGPRRKGSCWTDSIAVLRKGAWRCMAGNMIYDPCFSIGSRRGTVVCGANPASDQRGFVMELAKPLPAVELPARVKPEPWIMLLADGTICEKMTGTMALVAGRPVPWGCDDRVRGADLGEHRSYSGIMGDPHRGKVWTVEKVRFRATSNTAHPFQLLERKTVAIRTVWE